MVNIVEYGQQFNEYSFPYFFNKKKSCTSSCLLSSFYTSFASSFKSSSPSNSALCISYPSVCGDKKETKSDDKPSSSFSSNSFSRSSLNSQASFSSTPSLSASGISLHTPLFANEFDVFPSISSCNNNVNSFNFKFNTFHNAMYSASTYLNTIKGSKRNLSVKSSLSAESRFPLSFLKPTTSVISSSLQQQGLYEFSVPYNFPLLFHTFDSIHVPCNSFNFSSSLSLFSSCLSSHTSFINESYLYPNPKKKNFDLKNQNLNVTSFKIQQTNILPKPNLEVHEHLATCRDNNYYTNNLNTINSNDKAFIVHDESLQNLRINNDSIFNNNNDNNNNNNILEKNRKENKIKPDKSEEDVLNFKHSLEKYMQNIQNLHKKHEEFSRYSADFFYNYSYPFSNEKQKSHFESNKTSVEFKCLEEKYTDNLNKKTTKIRCSDEEILRGTKLLKQNSNKILIDKFNIEINNTILRCLLPKGWLNDEVINFYMKMLQERNTNQILANQNVPNCFFFNTFFFEKLSGGMNSSVSYDYQSVARWTRRLKVDIFSKDLIIVPINQNNVHWTLGVVDMREGSRRIMFYDSMGGCNEKLGKNIRRFIQDEHLDKKGTILSNVDEWKSSENCQSEVDAPQQLNGYDCGVFICQVAECISDCRSFDFTQHDINNIRIKMALQIVEGHIEI